MARSKPIKKFPERKCPSCKQDFLPHFKLQVTCCRADCVLKRRRENGKRAWTNPEQRARLMTAMHEPEALKRRGEASRASWKNPKSHRNRSRAIRNAYKNPELRQRLSKSIKAACADPEFRRRRSEILKRIGSVPEERHRRRERMQRVWKDPKYRKRTTRAMRKAMTPEVRQRIGEASRQLWARRNAILKAAGRPEERRIVGRPRKDEIRELVLKARSEGKSWKQTQLFVNHEKRLNLSVGAVRGYAKNSR